MPRFGPKRRGGAPHLEHEMTEPRTQTGRDLLARQLGCDPLECALFTEEGREPFRRSILAIESEADSLDAAWAEAEAALPEGWFLLELRRLRIGRKLGAIVWQAVAGPEGSDMPGVLPERLAAEDPAPAAALRALAAKLR